MQLQDDTEFTAFTAQRRRLNAMLDQSREELDLWMSSHLSGTVSVAEVARLSGLLQKRRDALVELAKLDDSLLTYLVGLAQKQGKT